ncbi:N-acetylneuraminate synthase [Neptuniibacter halophilus]|uniref:N-acetylneuraminate synthase n=1 Tax=Neptuniibacter halophilus TaxID=651666 RepID=UPI002573465E|nr:N-acetylneuraminate synthase [Neptuniibacter halophilus]
MKVEIIAEAGVNHNGDESLAFKLVEAASFAGADVVKFQTFKAEKLVTPEAEQAAYQIENTQKKESQLSMLSRLELSYEAHHRLLSRCNELGIEFLSTAFDSDSLRFLANDLGLKRLKIPSGELTNAPLLLEHARTGCDLIVSTGMSMLSEIEAALGVIAYGYISKEKDKPSQEAFELAYLSEEGREALRQKVTILHCTTEYPAPLSEINLNTMNTLRQAFNLPVGLSDHSEGINVPIAAVAKGATLIEKHFTLDRGMEGPDHKASLNPEQLRAMIHGVREVETALGNRMKLPSVSELQNRMVVRKSLVAVAPINCGESFTKENIAIMRPGNGISPYMYWDIIGTTAKRNFQAGDLIIV